MLFGAMWIVFLAKYATLSSAWDIVPAFNSFNGRLVTISTGCSLMTGSGNKYTWASPDQKMGNGRECLKPGMHNDKARNVWWPECLKGANDCLHQVPWHQFTILFSALQKNSSSSSLYTDRCRPNQLFDRAKLFHSIACSFNTCWQNTTITQ